MPAQTPPTRTYDAARCLELLKQYWGYDQLRPLQDQAIQAGVEGRDSLLVLPTGGGKSLTYQMPPLLTEKLHLVVSPLISLMKDQVDALRQNGYPAAALHSNLSSEEKTRIHRDLGEGRLRLLLTSPERLASPQFLEYLASLNVGGIAVDEAHCISHWGHDFRPDYRQLAALRRALPHAAMHACTATATPRVQQDIIEQLGLSDPVHLVGDYDRPNLTFRILPAQDVDRQIAGVLERHRGEGAIVYCMSRAQTERIATSLSSQGFTAKPYHAGLSPDQRSRTQEAFLQEQLDVVVATVAFGMGIDRSNVRCVIHAALPKSIEHYQQETGRAGRDGLPAECVLFYSFGDAIKWEGLLSRSAQEAGLPLDDPSLVAQLQMLNALTSFCGSAQCRHAALVRYFGQSYDKDDCGACDVCLEEVRIMPEATTVAQKILSGVARLRTPYGVTYVRQVLRGANTAEVKARGHDQLSTHGLLKELPEKAITQLIYQLVDQGLLERTQDDRPVLLLNEESWAVMRGERKVRLLEPVVSKKKARAAADDIPHDPGLFEHLRELRKQLASERGVPPYVVFGDRTLREMAGRQPTTRAEMAGITGVGQTKLDQYGQLFIDRIADWIGSEADTPPAAEIAHDNRQARNQATKEKAWGLFRLGQSVEEVAQQISRAPSTTSEYLVEWIEAEPPASLDAWVGPEVAERIRKAALECEQDGRLRPIFDALGGEVSYEAIKITLAHWRATEAGAG